MAGTVVLKINTKVLERAIRAGVRDLPGVIGQAVGDVMDKWQAAAVDIALKEFSTLRRGISTEQPDPATGLIKSVAIENGGKWGAFNYAYYWHEERKDSPPKNKTTSGTVPNYLEKSMADNKGDWERYIAKQVERRINAIRG